MTTATDLNQPTLQPAAPAGRRMSVRCCSWSSPEPWR
ncbi:hypothetical protein SFUMM280S_01553 [Streptomyces fumanus]